MLIPASGPDSQSRFTDVQLKPQEDGTLPERFNIGLTNLVSRPSSQAREVSVEEYRSSVVLLVKKVALHRPRFICFVGIGISEHFFDVLQPYEKRSKSSPKRQNKIQVGLQDIKLVHEDQTVTYVYVAPSTSGLGASYSRETKVELFTELKGLIDGDVESELTNWSTVDLTRYLRLAEPMIGRRTDDVEPKVEMVS